MSEGNPMFEWEKLGLILDIKNIKGKPDWFSEFAQAPNTIIFDNFVRIYFCCRPPPDKHGNFVSYGNYIDVSRNDPFQVIAVAQEPILQLGGLGTFDEFGTYPISAIKVDDVVYAYYGGWTRCESVPFNVSIGLSKSIDGGETFVKVGAGPILGPSLNEPFVVTSPKVRKYGETYYLTYTAGMKWFIHESRPEIVYKLRMAYSADGINWTRLGRNIIPDKLGFDEAQACGDILFRNGSYHMFFCYREATDFRFNKHRTYRIGYAKSEDLLNWTRDDSKAGIDISAEGWDSEMVAYPHVVEINNTVYMLYLGNEVGRYGFGVARLRGELL